MANTIDSGLVKEILEEEGLSSLDDFCQMVDAFTVELMPDGAAPRSAINVPYATAGSTVLTNPTNFEAGDSTLDTVTVTPDHKSKPFHVTQAELNQGHRLRHLFRKNMTEFAEALQDVIFTPMTTTLFGTAVYDDTAANFAAADLKTIWAGVANFPQKNLFLKGDWYANLLPTNAESFNPAAQGAYGFDRIFHNERWDGAGSKVIGFVGARSAIAIAAGRPFMTDSTRAELTGQEVVTLPNGLQVEFNTWVSRAGRAEWGSFDIMLGAAAADVTRGEVIEDGTA